MNRPPKSPAKKPPITPEQSEQRLRQARAYAAKNTEQLRLAFESDHRYFQERSQKEGVDVIVANAGVWVGHVVPK